MRKNNGERRAGITQDELLTILKQSGRPNFTKHRLTRLSSQGLLPHPKRISQAGSNAPKYVWKPEIVEQATFLYDLIERKIARYQLFLALWLVGYDVPFEPILRQWIESIDTLLHNLTGGTQDSDEALWRISKILVDIEPKWKFSPRPDNVIRAVGFDKWLTLMEFFFDVLAVPAYEPDEELSEQLQGTLRKVNTIAQTNADPQEMLSLIQSFREVFALPRYRETLTNATTEEWVQARDDYVSICQLLHQLMALFPRRNARLTAEMCDALFLHGGSTLPPLLLAVRYAGYGDWIDKALTVVSELLDDILGNAGMRKILAKM